MAGNHSSMTNNKDSNYNHELEYKQWDESYRDLAHDIRRIKTIARTVYLEPTTMYLFYNELVALNAGEDTYLVINGDKEKVIKNLERLDKTLYNKAFLKDMEQQPLPYKAAVRVRVMIKVLLETFNIFSKNFIECGIRPKPTTTKKAMSETEVDKQKRDEMLALEQLELIGR